MCRLDDGLSQNWSAVQITALVLDAGVVTAAVKASWQVRKLVRLHVNCASTGQSTSTTVLLIPPFIKSCHQVIEQCLWICILVKICAYVASWSLFVEAAKVSISFFPPPHQVYG